MSGADHILCPTVSWIVEKSAVPWCEEHAQKRVSREVIGSQLYVCYAFYWCQLVYHLLSFPLGYFFSTIRKAFSQISVSPWLKLSSSKTVPEGKGSEGISIFFQYCLTSLLSKNVLLPLTACPALTFSLYQTVPFPILDCLQQSVYSPWPLTKGHFVLIWGRDQAMASPTPFPSLWADS